MTHSTPRKIAVSLATYNRPLGLERVLDGIETQEIPQYVSIRVIIVDNSDDANACSYIQHRSTTYRWRLSYHHELARGISFARNKGLEDALAVDDDYIAFIDDDERPHRNWIKELLNVAVETGAVAVLGTVKAVYQKPPPWWIAKGKFFGMGEFADREPIPIGYTTNALAQLSYIRALGLRFDPRYALTGGEDTLFFRTIRDNGGKTVFSVNAVTYEYIVPSRATLNHLLKYWYRSANTSGLISMQLESFSPQSRLKVVGGGLTRAVVGAFGAITTLPTLTFKQVLPFTFLRITCRGLGHIAAAFGITFEQYRHHNR